MHRALALGVIATLGTLTIAVAAAQAPAGPSQAAVAVTKIEKVKDNLYIITGSGAEDTSAFSGGNTAVFITETRSEEHTSNSSHHDISYAVFCLDRKSVV